MAAIGQVAQAPTTSAAATLKYLYGSGSQTGGKDITLRIELTEPAPSGGANVTLAASNGAINVPASTTIAAGQSEKTITVGSDPVATNTNITVSATYLGVTKSRTVLIKAPVLTSLGLQTVIRHGGVGKVIARISGPAPAGGFAVTTSTDPSGHLDLDTVITIPAGETELSLKVPASLFQESNGIELLPDLPVDVTISAGTASFTKSTIIRDFGDDPRPTATATATATETATAMPTDTPTATSTATDTPTNTATATATDTPTNTATSTATSTATDTPTATNTATPTDTPTNTPTSTPTNTPIPPTATPTTPPVSAGCQVMNQAAKDGTYTIGQTFYQTFDGGDFLQVSAVAAGGFPLNDGFGFDFNGSVQTAGLPGTLSVTVPSDGTYYAEWFARIGNGVSGSVTFTVSCTPAP